MRSADIQNAVYQYAVDNGTYNAPYGILTSEHLDKNGKKYKSVTFGRSRILDAEVRIYNKNFMVVRTNRGSEKFTEFSDMMNFLKGL